MSTTADRTASPAFELEPYKSLENEELTARIQAVRAEMADRLRRYIAGDRPRPLRPPS